MDVIVYNLYIFCYRDGLDDNNVGGVGGGAEWRSLRRWPLRVEYSHSAGVRTRTRRRSITHTHTRYKPLLHIVRTMATWFVARLLLYRIIVRRTGFSCPLSPVCGGGGNHLAIYLYVHPYICARVCVCVYPIPCSR